MVHGTDEYSRYKKKNIYKQRELKWVWIDHLYSNAISLYHQINTFRFVRIWIYVNDFFPFLHMTLLGFFFILLNIFHKINFQQFVFLHYFDFIKKRLFQLLVILVIKILFAIVSNNLVGLAFHQPADCMVTTLAHR